MKRFSLPLFSSFLMFLLLSFLGGCSTVPVNIESGGNYLCTDDTIPLWRPDISTISGPSEACLPRVIGSDTDCINLLYASSRIKPSVDDLSVCVFVGAAPQPDKILKLYKIETVFRPEIGFLYGNADGIVPDKLNLPVLPAVAISEKLPSKEDKSSNLNDFPESDVPEKTVPAVRVFKGSEDPEKIPEPDKSVVHQLKRAETGEELTVSFDQLSAVYTRGEPTPEFSGKEIKSDRAEFSFKFIDAGEYRLYFSFQDLSEGRFWEEVIPVQVVDAPEPGKNLQVANENNREEESGKTEDVPDVGSDKEGIAGNSLELQMSGKDRAELIALASEKIESNMFGEAVIVLENAAELFSCESLDSVYYQLGSLYESSFQGRDFKKACYYYELIIAEYPLSEWYEKAGKRIHYIKKNYFYIQ